MSIANILKSFCALIIGGLIGYHTVKYYQNAKNDGQRQIASVPIAKIGQEHIARSYIDLQLELNGLAKSDSEVSTIKVTVTALKPIQNGLTYKWNLPGEVILLQGPQQDQLGEIAIGESKEFSIQVNGFSKELKRYLSFEIEGFQNQTPLNRELLVSSRIEDSLEYLIHQSEMSKKTDRAQKLDRRKVKSKFDRENVVR